MTAKASGSGARAASGRSRALRSSSPSSMLVARRLDGRGQRLEAVGDGPVAAAAVGPDPAGVDGGDVVAGGGEHRGGGGRERFERLDERVDGLGAGDRGVEVGDEDLVVDELA